ncbi:specifically androgen-regulated gene protein [Hoplias malabaricus]|uniref:specifically androgen-regulated gene protein n=1 Tax=Hoplias malabaricus TaxID=27720 RepID=UPI003461F58A
MDIHMHGNSCLHYGHNAYKQPPHTKEDSLQFLSLEEKECILFFEETIGSLEYGLEDNSTGLTSERTATVEDCSSTSNTAIATGLVEHDIIDLVHSTLDFTKPDIYSHGLTEEIKMYRTESNTYEDSSHHPPPGSIPTPVIIASKIAEQQGTNGTSSLSSVLVERRRSTDSAHSLPSKCGPPTHDKPHRLPDNINMMLGSRDPSPQSVATAVVSMQERRSQMLANLPHSDNHLEAGESACVQNNPSRSVTFRDPTKDKSRMEALSMLGLTQGRSPQGNPVPVTVTSNSRYNKVSSSAVITGNNASNSTANIANISPNATVSQKNSSPYKPSSTASSSAHIYSNANVSPVSTINQRKNSSTTFTPLSLSSNEPKAKCEFSTSNFNSYGGKSTIFTPPTTDSLTYTNKENRSSIALSPTSAEVKHIDLNSYGGKTLVLNPTSSFKAESVPIQSGPPETADIQINSYGGISRVIHPSMQTDVPDGPVVRSQSHNYSPSNTLTVSTHNNDLPSLTGSKSRLFPPIKADGQQTGPHYYSPVRDTAALPDLICHEAKPKALIPLHPEPVYQLTSRSSLSTAPPSTTPRPLSTSGSQRPRSDPVPTEIRSKPPPKPSFRTQGITVQFSGKGATDEARRDALRKLGLLKNTT